MASPRLLAISALLALVAAAPTVQAQPTSGEPAATVTPASCDGRTFTFAAQGAPPGETVLWTWEGSNFTIADAGEAVTHTFPLEGYHIVELSVRNATGDEKHETLAFDVPTACAPILPLPDKENVIPGETLVTCTYATGVDSGSAVFHAGEWSSAAGQDPEWPEGATLDAAGCLAWTPTVADTGSHSLAYWARHRNGDRLGHFWVVVGEDSDAFATAPPGAGQDEATGAADASESEADAGPGGPDAGLAGGGDGAGSAGAADGAGAAGAGGGPGGPDAQGAAADAPAPASLPLGLAVAAGATAGAAAASPWLWNRRWWLLALFSRLAPHRVAEHPTRADILAQLRTRPGVGVHDLCRAFGKAQGVVNYHLQVLVTNRLVEKRRWRGTVGYYARGDDGAAGQNLLRSATVRAILAAMQADRDVTATALASRLGLARGTVTYHVARLRQAGLLPPGPGAHMEAAPPNGAPSAPAPATAEPGQPHDRRGFV